MKKMLLAAAIISICSVSALAAPCRDAKGRFTKCPTIPPAPATAARCKDAKGRFAKCTATTTMKTTKTSTTTTAAGAH